MKTNTNTKVNRGRFFPLPFGEGWGGAVRRGLGGGLLALLLSLSGCNDDKEAALALNPRTIGVPKDRASYTLDISSDAAWTAAISYKPSWLSISPDAGEGNGAITMSLEENNTFFPRTASVKVTAGAVSRSMDITQGGLPKPDAPPTANSTTTWIFGTQLWSDFIAIPECKRAPQPGEFSDINSDPPQCAAFEYEGKTHYVYNWPYMLQHAATLCPSPWQMPSKADIEALVSNVFQDDLVAAWGLPGYIFDGVADKQGQQHLMWSGESEKWFLLNVPTAYALVNWDVPHGMQVRCIAK
jgi:hypothetical protein